ncbi:MAG: hypothetical protein FWD98_01215 [Defluviitaleaceae bacterium]|nr:hypothetical protein [Defluviitaleaceae bacterium]
MPGRLRSFLNIVSTAAAIAAIITVLALAWLFFSGGVPDHLGLSTTAFVLRANFAAGAFVILAGFYAALPSIKTHIWADAEDLLRRREQKRERSFKMICTGICNVGITGIIEYILFLLR